MTLYHFSNCLALVYVPFYLTYKQAGLSEYGAFWKCVQASMMYMLTQLIKMMFIATFFPTTEASEGLLSDIFKYSVDFADLVGIYLVLASIPGKGHSKVLTAALGWAGAEILLTRFVLLWFGARGQEFQWLYIHKCFESNISLVQHIATSALVWLWSRHNVNKTLQPIIVTLLAVSIFKPLIVDAIIVGFHVGIWAALLVKATFTLFFGFITLQIYSNVAQSIGVY